MLPQPALMTLAEQSASLARERTACAEELARARAMGAPARCCTFAMLRAAHYLGKAVIWPRGRKANCRSILLSRRAKGPRRHPRPRLLRCADALSDLQLVRDGAEQRRALAAQRATLAAAGEQGGSGVVLAVRTTARGFGRR